MPSSARIHVTCLDECLLSVSEHHCIESTMLSFMDGVNDDAPLSAFYDDVKSLLGGSVGVQPFSFVLGWCVSVRVYILSPKMVLKVRTSIVLASCSCGVSSF